MNSIPARLFLPPLTALPLPAALTRQNASHAAVSRLQSPEPGIPTSDPTARRTSIWIR